MYYEKLLPILTDLENKDVEIAGGSVVCMVLSITNALIDYICNLTVGKKNYQDVQDEVLLIQNDANDLRVQVLKAIDKDKEVLENLLNAYKTKKEKPEEYENKTIEAVEFCIDVTEKAYETLKLSDRISKIGNRMLASDFEICKIYSFAAIEASIVNVKINLDAVENENYKMNMTEKYEQILKKAKNL